MNVLVTPHEVGASHEVPEARLRTAGTVSLEADLLLGLSHQEPVGSNLFSPRYKRRDSLTFGVVCTVHSDRDAGQRRPPLWDFSLGSEYGDGVGRSAGGLAGLIRDSRDALCAGAAGEGEDAGEGDKRAVVQGRLW